MGDCTFIENSAANQGGGMLLMRAEFETIHYWASRMNFTGNTAAVGGAISALAKESWTSSTTYKEGKLEFNDGTVFQANRATQKVRQALA